MDVDVVVVPEPADEPAAVELSPAALEAVETAVAEGVAEGTEQLQEAVETAVEPPAGALLIEDLEPEPDVVTLPRAEYDDLLHRVTILELAEAQAAEQDSLEGEPMPPPPRDTEPAAEGGAEDQGVTESAGNGRRERAPGYGSKLWYGGRGR